MNGKRTSGRVIMFVDVIMFDFWFGSIIFEEVGASKVRRQSGDGEGRNGWDRGGPAPFYIARSTWPRRSGRKGWNLAWRANASLGGAAAGVRGDDVSDERHPIQRHALPSLKGRLEEEVTASLTAGSSLCMEEILWKAQVVRFWLQPLTSYRGDRD